jgi:hypothetical protein
MRASHSQLHVAAVVSLMIGALACSGGQTSTSPTSSASSSTVASGGNASGGSSGSSNGSATLAIHLTDSPFSAADAFLVTFSEVSVHSADTGAWTTLAFTGGATSRTCDLKQLQAGGTDLLGTTPLTVGGKYTQIRLTVVSALLYPSSKPLGTPCVSGFTPPAGGTPVDVPSGEVKLNQEFTVGAGKTTSIVLDFDGDQSVHQTGSGNGNGHGNPGYIMSPVIRVVSVTQS